MTSRTLIGLAVAILFACAPNAYGLTVSHYEVIPDDPGPGGIYGVAMSADGSTVVGGSVDAQGAYQVWQWRSGTGSRLLTVPPELGRSDFRISSISGDGNRAMGSVRTVDDNGVEGFLWDFESGATTRIDIPDSFGRTSATSLSDDGNVVAGDAVTSLGEAVAFRWDATTGVERIDGFARYGSDVQIYSISEDGSVIAGKSRVPFPFGSERGVPFVWDATQGVRHITEPTEDGYYPGGTPFDISTDGSIVVGDSGDRAFVWDESAGMRFLDPSGLLLDPNYRSPYQWAFAVSGDGSVVVGEFYGTEFGGQEVNGGFVWDEESGMQRLDVLLRASGLDGIDKIRGTLVTDISSDGTKLLVSAWDQMNGERLMIVTIPEPSSAVLIGLGLVVFSRHRRGGAPEG